MPAAFNYKPKFVDIRVRPPKEGEEEARQDVNRLKPGEKECDWPDCRKAGATRAPKSRETIHEHYWFCQAHAGEYNKNWDFFAGMTDAEQRAVYESRATGERPTWKFNASRLSREAAAFAGRSGHGKAFRDSFGMFGDGVAGRAPPAAGPALGKLERRALGELDLEPGAAAGVIRVRYLELVKRCHPDTNGGDRSTEDKLQRVLKAYKALRAAKLV